MNCLSKVLLILDIIAFFMLMRVFKKNRFKRKYHLSNKRYYFLMLIVLLLVVYSCSPRLCSAFTSKGELNHKHPKELKK